MKTLISRLAVTSAIGLAATSAAASASAASAHVMLAVAGVFEESWPSRPWSI